MCDHLNDEAQRFEVRQGEERNYRVVIEMYFKLLAVSHLTALFKSQA
jgi:hypothetical protein